MKLLLSGLVWVAAFGSCPIAASCQASKDSNLVASVNTMKLKLALSDSVARQLLNAENVLIASLDSLNVIRILTSDSSGRVLVRAKHRYLDQVQSILTPTQWTNFQQQQSAARDSFYVRMSGKNIPIKELDLGN